MQPAIVTQRHYCLEVVSLSSAGIIGINYPSPKTAQSSRPVLGYWSSSSRINTARYGHTATLLPDGKVLVAGGSVSE